jgi:subtilisin family serine protease/predicted acylesterase/phospholipase RssA
VGIALSGGGHRASLFGLGVLLYLADAERNHDVRSIASVSGGSLTNGYVAQTLRYRAVSAAGFEEAMRPFAVRLAHAGTFMNAEITPRFKTLILATLPLAAVPAWLLPGDRAARLSIAVGLVAVWALLVLRHLFATRLGQAYAVLLAASLYLAAVGPWLLPIAGPLAFAVFVAAIAAWASLVLGPRGRVCAHAFRTTLFSPESKPTGLAEIPTDIDHVICATDLQSAEQVYFSGSFVYGYRYGVGTPGDLPLYMAVQASAALPGAFPPRWVPTAGFGFRYPSKDCPKSDHRLEKPPRHLVLSDGGDYDNMADQWAQGFENRARCWPDLPKKHHEPDELIVVNASAGAEMVPMRRARIPILGEIAALWRVKDVLYDQTTAVRRQGLVGRFDRAELQKAGMRGALVHIAQSPFDVARAFAPREDWLDRAVRARDVLMRLGDTHQEWEEVAAKNAAVKTSLSRLGTDVAARLLWHGYVLAMTNLHVILDYPLLRIPDRRQFEAFIDGTGRISLPASPGPPEPTPGERAKLEPKLRMYANGSNEVNTVRAELSPALTVSGPRPDEVLTDARNVVGRQELPDSVDRGSLTKATEPTEVRAHVFIGLVEDFPLSAELHPGQSARRGDLAAATVPLAEVEQLAARPEVTSVELGERLHVPIHEKGEESSTPPVPTVREFGHAARHHGGEGVLIGIVDVQGFDFAHPDFADGNGGTRFVRIWDQGGNARRPPSAPGSSGFDYGAEFEKHHLDKAIAKAEELGIPAVELEAQSQMAPGSHGTHVASIAAGNHGVCPNAFIAGVLVSLSDEDLDRRGTFSDSTRIAHAIDYLLRVAEELRIEHGLDRVPVSINVSLGTNGHAHDGSSAISRWIDAALSAPGRCVSVAAGNAGQHVAEFEGDLGWVMGLIHTAGELPATSAAGSGSDHVIEWVVVGNGRVDISENELELWYSPQDRIAVSVTSPSGERIGPVDPREFVENKELRDGSFLSIYNELYHPANGCNTISIYLSPFLSQQGVVGIATGTWKVELHPIEVCDGRYHAWIERDDPRRQGRIGPREAWRFPSYFSDASAVDRSTVSSLACGHAVVSVANLDEAKSAISITSSQGPTRDGRNKPDIAAPGTDILAANGFAGEGDPWIEMSGTSMASPYAAGIAGLMLAVEPQLSSAQIGAIMQRTATSLQEGSCDWRDDAGYGRLQPDACLAEAASAQERKDLFR